MQYIIMYGVIWSWCESGFCIEILLNVLEPYTFGDFLLALPHNSLNILPLTSLQHPITNFAHLPHNILKPTHILHLNIYTFLLLFSICFPICVDIYIDIPFYFNICYYCYQIT